MKTPKIKSLTAAFLSALITVQSVEAAGPFQSGSSPTLRLPRSIGYVSERYAPTASARQPDFILIQNLHTNRSVQFGISRILNQISKARLLPERIAIEGAVGPVDLEEMQSYPDVRGRRRASDYLVSQGEMPGPVHFVVTKGKGGLYGVETADLYDSTIEMFRRSYQARRRVREELDKFDLALARLSKDRTVNQNASALAKDSQALRNLVDQKLIPSEVSPTLQQAVIAIDRLQSFLPEANGKALLEPVTAAVNFYALALLRDGEMLKHALELRQMDQQKTTVLVIGGFHTPGLTRRLKAQRMSYVVITPHVKRHTAVDERLYVERMLGRHLTLGQVAEGKDWAAVAAEPPLGPYLPRMFWTFIGRDLLKPKSISPSLERITNARGRFLPEVAFLMLGLSSLLAWFLPTGRDMIRQLPPEAKVVAWLIAAMMLPVSLFSLDWLRRKRVADRSEVFPMTPPAPIGTFASDNVLALTTAYAGILWFVTAILSSAILNTPLLFFAAPAALFINFGTVYLMFRLRYAAKADRIEIEKVLRTRMGTPFREKYHDRAIYWAMKLIDKYKQQGLSREDAIQRVADLYNKLQPLLVEYEYHATSQQDGSEGSYSIPMLYPDPGALHGLISDGGGNPTPQPVRPNLVKRQQGISMPIVLIGAALLTVGISVALPSIVPLVAAASAWVWITGAVLLIATGAAYGGTRLYLNHQTQRRTAAVKEAEIVSLAARIRARLPSTPFSFTPVKDAFNAVRFPWIKPSVQRQIDKERSQLLFGSAA